LPEWIIKFLEQWAVVKAAPIPFIAAVVIVGAVLWLLIGWSYTAVLNSKNAQIELQDRQLADYKEKLGGASPSEAKAELDALKEKVRHTIGDKWTPLTASEVAALRDRLAASPKKIAFKLCTRTISGRT
jgi:hypothetical protein